MLTPLAESPRRARLGGVEKVMDRRVRVNVSATCATAYVLWAGAVGLWLASWVDHSPTIGRLSLIVCGAAVTATVRSYCVELSQRIRNALAVFYDVERESGKPVRSIH
jgi:hypothetical protein